MQTHSLNFKIYLVRHPLGTHKLRFAAFLQLGIVHQTGSAVQSDTTAIQAIVVGFLTGLVGKEVSSLLRATDVSGTWRNPGIGLNVALQSLHLN